MSLPKIPSSMDELGRSIEAGVSDAGSSVKKSAGQTTKSTVGQLEPTTDDWNAYFYGSTNSEQKPPQEGEQQPQEKPHTDPNARTESTLDQLIGGASHQSAPLPDKPPILRSNEEKFGNVADQVPFIPGQRQTDVDSSRGSVTEEVPFMPFQKAGETSALSEQLSGQSSSKDTMAAAGVDPNKQMSLEDKAKLNEEQKRQREHMREHNREYIKFGTPLDPIGTLEEQIAKEKKKKEEEERKKQQEEQEKKEKKRKEEEQKRRELQPPKGKKRGVPDFALKKEQTKAEKHRGTVG